MSHQGVNLAEAAISTRQSLASVPTEVAAAAVLAPVLVGAEVEAAAAAADLDQVLKVRAPPSLRP